MLPSVYAIATENEVEAVDLADILRHSGRGEPCRIAFAGATDWPTGLAAPDLPGALFLGLGRGHPHFELLSRWARDHAVKLVVINGASRDHGGELTLARPFTEEDVARILAHL